MKTKLTVLLAFAAEQTYVHRFATNKIVSPYGYPGSGRSRYVPELKKCYTSNAHDNTLGVVDLSKWKVVRKLTDGIEAGRKARMPAFTNSMFGRTREGGSRRRRSEGRNHQDADHFRQRNGNAAVRSG